MYGPLIARLQSKTFGHMLVIQGELKVRASGNDTAI